MRCLKKPSVCDCNERNWKQRTANGQMELANQRSVPLWWQTKEKQATSPMVVLLPSLGYTICRCSDAFSSLQPQLGLNAFFFSFLSFKHLHCSNQWRAEHKFAEHNWCFRTENPGNESCLQLLRNNNIYGNLDNCLEEKSSYLYLLCFSGCTWGTLPLPLFTYEAAETIISFSLSF